MNEIIKTGNPYLKYYNRPDLTVYPDTNYKCKRLKHQYELVEGKYTCSCGRVLEETNFKK